MIIGVQTLYAERVKSMPSVTRKRPPRPEFYETLVGKIMLEMSEHFDDMNDLQWNRITESLARVFRSTRAKRGRVITKVEKIETVVAILKPIAYLHEKKIREIVSNIVICEA